MPKKSPKKSQFDPIFIVYQSHEERVAYALKKLLNFWGHSAYYCRQEKRDNETYKRELRERLSNAELVIILLSRELHWSAYCHAEIGTAMMMQKKILTIIIPPATQKEANSIAPVMEGYWMEDANDWIEDANNWVGDIDKWKEDARHDLFTRLKNRIEDKLGSASDHLDKQQEVDESVLIDSLMEQMSKVKQSYLHIPQRTLLRVWPRPALEKGSPACNSIIKNIQQSLSGNKPLVRLAFVGVSLKYSLKLITEALEQFAKESKFKPSSSATKKLQIKLVHMDDQAHFLHALKDYEQDINTIRHNFHTSWDETLRKWREHCQAASIELLPPEVHTIDYIPPRVGILIDYADGAEGDHCVFYAGRCAFNEPGNGFRLWVGELEYLFFTNGDAEGHIAIEEFKCFLKVYASRQYNAGVVVAPDSKIWVDRLQEYLEHYSGIKTITVVSISGHRCEQLIIAALKRGVNVNIYVQDAEYAPKEFRKAIKALGEGISRSLRADIDSPLGVASVYYYKLPSTFRAVLIEGTCLGIQMYIRPRPPQGGVAEFTVGGPLPLIIPADSLRFSGVKAKTIDLFFNANDVDKKPSYKIKNGAVCSENLTS